MEIQQYPRYSRDVDTIKMDTVSIIQFPVNQAGLLPVSQLTWKLIPM